MEKMEVVVVKVVVVVAFMVALVVVLVTGDATPINNPFDFAP